MWLIRKEAWAVSHSCNDRIQVVDTPINSHEWPVPILSDTTLDRVRVELLNYEAEYVWLDVLCLRQKGSEEKEILRLEEWSLDVPTIGNVYHQNQVIYHYYSGLGRPFRIGDLKSERHWLNRAWTLQEISVNSIIAGIAAYSPISPAIDDEGQYVDSDVGQFYTTLGDLSRYSQEADNAIPVLMGMRNRAAVNELDKIAGLAYLLRSLVLPAYIANQPHEDAWANLVNAMHGRYRGDLLFLYPSPGDSDGHHLWYPSWRQVKETILPKTGGIYLHEDVMVTDTEQTAVFRLHGYILDNCVLEGLEESYEVTDTSEPRHHRRGKVPYAGDSARKLRAYWV
jgi:hypothetical protein